MLGEVESHTEFPPPNLSDLGPMDTGYMHIHKSEALTDFCLLVHLLASIKLELYNL